MSHTSDEVRTKLRHHLLKNFLFTEDPGALADDASFLDAGFVDSTGIMEVIQFLEEAFGVRVADTEMTPDNLDSVDSIVAFVTRKQAA